MFSGQARRHRNADAALPSPGQLILPQLLVPAAGATAESGLYPRT